MPTPRRPVQRDIAAPGFRPVAYPVDTFAGPGLAGNTLSQLAEGLSTFAPALERFASVKYQEQDKKTKEALDLQAQQDYERLLSEGRTFSEAMRDGVIENHQNPFYRNYYKNQIGKLMGYDAYAQWRVVRESDLAEATTLDEYDDRFGQFFQDYREANFGDEAPSEGFNNVFLQALNQDRIAFASEAAGRMAQYAFENLQAEGSKLAQSMVRAGASAADIAARLNDTRQAFFDIEGAALTPQKRRLATMSLLRGYTSGLVALASDPTVPEGVAQQYLTEVLGKIQSGPGIAAIDDPRVASFLDEVRGKIARATSIATTEIDRRETEAVSGYLARGMEALFSGDPRDHTRLDALFTEVSGLPPALQARAMPIIENLQQIMYNFDRSHETETNEAWMRDLYAQAIRNPGNAATLQQRVASALSTRTISWEDGQRAYQFLNSMQDESISGDKGVLTNTVFKSLEDRISGVLRNPDLSLWTVDSRNKLELSLTAFRVGAIDWRKENPTATQQEMEQHLWNLHERLLNEALTPRERELLKRFPLPNELQLRFREAPDPTRVPVFGADPVLFNSLMEWNMRKGTMSPFLKEGLRALGYGPEILTPDRLEPLLAAQRQFYMPSSSAGTPR